MFLKHQFDCNGTWTHNHLICETTHNHFGQLGQIVSGWGFESCGSHLTLRYCIQKKPVLMHLFKLIFHSNHPERYFDLLLKLKSLIVRALVIFMLLLILIFGNYVIAYFDFFWTFCMIPGRFLWKCCIFFNFN